MKPIIEYIIEKQSLTKLAITLAKQMIKAHPLNGADELQFTHKALIRNKEYIYHIIIGPEESNCSFGPQIKEIKEKFKNDEFIKKNSDAKTSEELLPHVFITYTSHSYKVDTVSHEIRHSFDFIFHNDEESNLKNNTYEIDSVEATSYFDEFLYTLSLTERNAFYTCLKSQIKNGDYDELIEHFIKLTNSKNTDDLVKKCLVNLVQSKHDIIKKYSKKAPYPNKEHAKFTGYNASILKKSGEQLKKYLNKNNIELSDEEFDILDKNIMNVQAPFALCVYKFTILKDVKSFENFILNDEIDGEPRDKQTKEYIVRILSNAVGSKELITDVKQLYSKVNAEYLKTYNQYANLLDKKYFSK